MLKSKLRTCCNYKIVCVVIGVLYVILTSLNLIWSFYAIRHDFSRLLLINITIQCLLLLVSLFYVINVYYRIKELLIPFLIALIYSIVLLVGWIVLMFLIEIISYEQKILILHVDVQTKLRLLPFLCFCIFTYSFSAYFLIKVYLSFGLRGTKSGKVSNRSFYAYRRFG